MNNKGYVHSFETFASSDGPGVRFLVFLQGCDMRCLFCHNPDTWKKDQGELIEASSIIERAKRYKPYFKEKGGITVSGGEPLLQIDFLIQLFKLAKEENINTAVDTAGQPFTYEEPFYSKFVELMKYTDLFILDLKHIDDNVHKKITSCSNKNIIELFYLLDKSNKNVWVRHVLFSYTDDDKYLYEMRDFLNQFTNIKRIEVLPYHSLGVFKWDKLGIKYRLKDEKRPSVERIKNAEDILNNRK